jgi:uncharacterized protein (DUF2141 family)
MKSILKLSSIGVLMCLYSFSLINEKKYQLTVTVNDLRNSTGYLQFALYNNDGTIPDENYTKFYKKETVVIKNNAATITFKDLPANTYAVNILHDENKNGKIDKGFILPIEGVGFSNYESIGLTNRPKFSKASFQLTSDKTIAVKIIYF